MADFADAGGLPVVTAELLRGGLLHGDLPTITGDSVAANVAGARCWRPEVIRTLGEPLQPPVSATAVLTGNLCPGGAVLKVSAASRSLLSHRGTGARLRLDRGVQPGSREPRHGRHRRRHSRAPLRRATGLSRHARSRQLAAASQAPRRRGQRHGPDLGRRMSGTAFGTVVLHVAPEAAVGGPLALVRTGDEITLDVTRTSPPARGRR